MRNRRPPPHSEQPALTVDPRHLDFGEVWETDAFELKLPVRNTSSVPLRLADWKSSCSCLGVEPSGIVFQPHDERTVTVKIDLASKLSRQTSQPQPVAVDFSAVLDNGQIATWQIRGAVKPIVKVRPDLIIPPLSELAQPLGVRQVVVEFTEPVAIESLEVDSPLMTAHASEVLPSPQANQRIELRFATAIPAGEHSFTLSVRGAVGSVGKFVKRFAGVLRVVADVQGDPGQIVFPARAVGGECEEVVMLKSLTGRAFDIVSMSADGEGLTATRVEGEPKLIVRQRGEKTGQQTTRVRVGIRSGERSSDVVIPVTSLWINP